MNMVFVSPGGVTMGASARLKSLGVTMGRRLTRLTMFELAFQRLSRSDVSGAVLFQPLLTA